MNTMSDKRRHESYCELVLYVGRCHADGLPAGRFPATLTDPYSMKRMSDALKTIERYLRPTQRWGLVIDYNSLVSSNAEADRLAGHALKHFPYATEVLEPHQCIHGKIIFSRKIRYPGCSEEAADAIVRVMKESGHLPNEFVLKVERVRKLHASEGRVREEIGELEKEIDRIWRAALKFYSRPV
jgi:hypothetical protein